MVLLVFKPNDTTEPSTVFGPFDTRKEAQDVEQDYLMEYKWALGSFYYLKVRELV